jgi:hypothetical protein
VVVEVEVVSVVEVEVAPAVPQSVEAVVEVEVVALLLVQGQLKLLGMQVRLVLVAMQQIIQIPPTVEQQVKVVTVQQTQAVLTVNLVSLPLHMEQLLPNQLSMSALS